MPANNEIQSIITKAYMGKVELLQSVPVETLRVAFAKVQADTCAINGRTPAQFNRTALSHRRNPRFRTLPLTPALWLVLACQVADRVAVSEMVRNGTIRQGC